MAYTGYETELTEEEKNLMKQIESSQGYAGTGSAIGTAIGGGLGALGFLGTPALAAITLPAGMAVGGALGGLIGGGVGAASGERSMEELQKLQEAKTRPALEKQAQAEALQKLLGKYNVYGV